MGDDARVSAEVHGGILCADRLLKYRSPIRLQSVIGISPRSSAHGPRPTTDIYPEGFLEVTVHCGRRGRLYRVGTGVVGTTYGVSLGGVGVINCGVSRGVVPACNPGVPPWITLGCFGDGVADVEGMENLSL